MQIAAISSVARWALPALTAGFLGACGGGGGGGQKLSAQQAANVANYESAFATNVVDGSRYDAVLNGIDYLITLCRKNPAAKYDGRTMRQVVEDGANTLEQNHPEDAAKLSRVAGNGCK